MPANSAGALLKDFDKGSMESKVNNLRSQNVIGMMPGALLDSIATGFIVITDVGKKTHAKGYGDTDFRGYHLSGSLSVGTMVKTPWGMCEIVKQPSRCRLVSTSWDQKKRYGAPGSPSGIMTTLAAAKAMNQDISRLSVEVVELENR